MRRLVLDKTGWELIKILVYLAGIESKNKLLHSQMVALIGQYLSRRLCPGSAATLYLAGLTHDLGTFDVSNESIHRCLEGEDARKNGEIYAHPQRAAALVASFGGFMPLAKMIMEHHEWVNGKGYPRGLKQEEISPEGQILRIADSIAFLLGKNGITRAEDVLGKLKVRVGREFSADVYDCARVELGDKKRWRSLVDKKDLAAADKKIYGCLAAPPRENNRVCPREVLHFLGRLLGAKYAYTQGHCLRVSYFSLLLALAMGIGGQEAADIEFAGMLHDVGKLGVPKFILNKPSALTREEFKVIRQHAGFSYEIVREISLFRRLSPIVGADQEHWDGSGYPRGLKAGQIPLGARIIFVADAFDAMTSDRVYRKAMTVGEAIKELRRCAGRDFDPQVVKVASRVF